MSHPTNLIPSLNLIQFLFYAIILAFKIDTHETYVTHMHGWCGPFFVTVVMFIVYISFFLVT